MEELLRERLEQLRRRGNPGVAPLWAELIPPEEFLAQDFAPSPWVALMKARALAATGRAGEALETLSTIDDARPGIEGLRRELEASLGASSKGEGAEQIARLTGWLDNVLHWRARLDREKVEKREADA